MIKRINEINRRRFLQSMAYAGVGLFVSPTLLATARQPDELTFLHTHTGERLKVQYRDENGYLPDGLNEINYFLRDFRTDDVHPMDTGLLDILNELRLGMSENGVFEVISGYRSPKTNESLRANGSGVAKHSLHMQGRAIDIRLTGVETSQLRNFCIRMECGGVGYYQKSDFIHVDTGRIRSW